jgi:hypothetical protein
MAIPGRAQVVEVWPWLSVEVSEAIARLIA